MPALFTGTLREDEEAIAALAAGLDRLRTDRQLVIADRDRRAHPGAPRRARLDLRDAARARGPGHLARRDLPLPRRRCRAATAALEIAALRLRPEAGRARPAGRRAGNPGARPPRRPGGARGPGPVDPAAERRTSSSGSCGSTIRGTSRRRRRDELARLLRLLQQRAGERGLLPRRRAAEEQDVEPNEVNVLFAVESPPPRDYLTQLFEVFNAPEPGRPPLAHDDRQHRRPPVLPRQLPRRPPRGARSLEKDGELFRQAAAAPLQHADPRDRVAGLPRLRAHRRDERRGGRRSSTPSSASATRTAPTTSRTATRSRTWSGRSTRTRRWRCGSCGCSRRASTPTSPTARRATRRSCRASSARSRPTTPATGSSTTSGARSSGPRSSS